LSFTRENAGLLRGAGILAGAAFLVKAIGGFLRIPLTRMMGPEGMGLYQMAYSVYGLMISVFVSGFPLAVSRMVAEARARGAAPEAVLRASLGLLVMTGAVGSVFLYRGADFLAGTVMGDPRAAGSIRAIAPALVMVSAMAALRGYHQGLNRQEPTALSQVAEQIVRVVTALTLVAVSLPLGLARAAQGAALGTSAGSVAGLTTLVVITRLGPRGRCGASVAGMLALKTAGLAVPTSLAALLLPALDALNAVLLPRRLIQAGLETETATALYGQLAGVALPLMGLPAIISISMAAALVPQVAISHSSGRKSTAAMSALTALRFTIYTAMPATTGIMVLARPLGETVFSLPEVVPLIALVAPGCLFLALQQSTTGILLGLGRPLIPGASLLLALSLTGSLLYLLAPIPGWGIMGAAGGLALGLGVACCWNLYFTTRAVTLPIWGDALRLIVASAAMAAMVGAVYPGLSYWAGEWGGLALAVLVGVGVYLASTARLLLSWLRAG